MSKVQDNETIDSAESDLRIAHNLKAIRRARGLTLEDLAAQTNLSLSYLSRLESGNRKINLDILVTLSKSLQCEVTDLIYGNMSNLISFVELGKLLSGNYYSVSSNDISFEVSKRGRKKTQVYIDHSRLASQSVKPSSKDVPLYRRKSAKPGEVSEEGIYDFSGTHEYIYRPQDLMEMNDVFAIAISDNDFSPRYYSGDILIAYPSKTPIYKTPVFLIMKDNSVVPGFFKDWVSDGVSIFVFKNGALVETLINKDKMKSLYCIHSAIYG